jgi:hypothetical protein
MEGGYAELRGASQRLLQVPEVEEAQAEVDRGGTPVPQCLLPEDLQRERFLPDTGDPGPVPLWADTMASSSPGRLRRGPVM